MNYSKTGRQRLAAEMRAHPDIKEYLDSLPKVKLTLEEEQALIIRKCAGDTDARADLITANLLLVVSVASNYIGFAVETMDLIMAGNRGLIVAVDKSRPGHGAFFALASNWIMDAVTKELMNMSHAIRLPNRVAANKRKVTKAENELGKDATDEAIAQHTDISLSAVKLVRHLQTKAASLDAPNSVDAKTIASLMSGDDVDTRIIARERHDLMLQEVERLNTQERAIVAMRYGLGSVDAKLYSRAEMARVLGMTIYAATSLEMRTLGKIKAGLVANGFTE